MDLSTIQTNVKHNLYESLAEFDRDLQKIWKNAMQYNQRDSEIYSMATDL